MLTLNDGRTELWQWDTGRTLAVDADCSQVHFSNKVFGRSIDVDVVGGTAIIPDVLLQTDKDLNVWAFVGTAENGYTKISKTFKVNRRNKPADYVFTHVEQTTIAEIAAIAQSVRDDADAGLFKGDTGATGPKGETGPQGPKGDTGAAGEAGGYYTPAVTKPDENTLRVAFTPSKEGMPAVADTDITLPAGGGGGGSGTSGEDGGYYAPSLDDEGNLTWTASKTDMPAVDGANIKGPKGDTGATGAQGPKGYTGATGAQGPAGATGPAGADGKSAYAYAVEGGYTGTEAEFAAKLAAEKFANPNALTFTGAVTGSYDGSAALSVEIPSGGGRITVTNTAAVGQTVRITGVDETGQPTEWEAVDMASATAVTPELLYSGMAENVKLFTQDIDFKGHKNFVIVVSGTKGDAGIDMNEGSLHIGGRKFIFAYYSSFLSATSESAPEGSVIYTIRLISPDKCIVDFSQFSTRNSPFWEYLQASSSTQSSAKTCYEKSPLATSYERIVFGFSASVPSVSVDIYGF